MRSGFLLVCGLFVASLTVSSRQLAAEVEQAVKIREILQKKVEPGGPGAVVAVLREGKVIFQGEFGEANVEEKIPLKPHTVFDLASCSKQFTAMAILILHQRGKLSVEDDVRKFLPELREHNAHRPIAIADLLHMTSGLPEYTSGMDDIEQKTNLDVLHWVARQPLAFPTGGKFDYCNTNYVLLPLIVERASRRPFAQFMQSEIFEPAGMHQTVILEHPGQPVKHRAQGYTRTKHGFKKRRDDTGIVGDGQVMTTVDDMANWDRVLWEGKLVKPETLNQAFTPAKLDNGKPTDYGFGWEVGRDRGQKYVDHEGGWAGTNSYIVRYLNDRLTVIVLSNIDNFNAGKVGSNIAALFPKSGG